LPRDVARLRALTVRITEPGHVFRTACYVGAMEGAYRRRRITVYVMTWVAYASYYMCRKQFAVCKTTLVEEFGFSLKQLDFIETGYLAAYAFGQFASGVLCDRIGARRL